MTDQKTYRMIFAADDLNMDFEKKFQDWGMEYLQAISKRYHYLAPDQGTAEDLFQDLWLKVWTKAVDRWPDFHEKSKNPVFENWIKLLLQHYLTDLGRKAKTGPQQLQKKQLHLDAPAGAEGGGSTLLDFQETPEGMKAFEEIESTEVIDKIMDELEDQPNLQRAVQILLEDRMNEEGKPATQQDRMRWIKEETEQSPHQILRLLRENPRVRELLDPAGSPV